MSESTRAYRAGRATPEWDAARLLTLRRDLGLTQQQLAGELGVRQQTISEWETGVYRPRGASVRLLGIVAERAGIEYRAGTERDDEVRPGSSNEGGGAE